MKTYKTIPENKKVKNYFIHDLVGIYFIPNPDNKPTINHMFGNKEDNYYKHLEWNSF